MLTRSNQVLPDMNLKFSLIRKPVVISHKPSGDGRVPASKILDHVYLGDEVDASKRSHLDSLGITDVLRISSCPLLNRPMVSSSMSTESNNSSSSADDEEEAPDDELNVQQIIAEDSPTANLYDHFASAFRFLDEAERNSRKVLVHCSAGISRSATIVIAYLMWRKRISHAEAYREVKDLRPVISPNLNFMGQLVHFERDLQLNY